MFIKIKWSYNGEEVCEGNQFLVLRPLWLWNLVNRVVFVQSKKARIQTALLSFTDFKNGEREVD